MRSSIPFFLSTFAVAALALIAPTDSEASTSVALTVTDLARSAEAIARVTPIAKTSAWEGGRIVTTTRVRVDATLAGAAPSTLEVRTLGGVVGDVGQTVEGEAELGVGTSAVLFLARHGDAMRVVGRAQGRWIVAKDASAREIVRVVGTGALVARPTRGPSVAHARLATALDGASLDEAALEAAQAWRSTHAR